MVASNDYQLSFDDIAKKLNRHHLAIDVFLSTHHKKEGHGRKKKPTKGTLAKIIIENNHFQCVSKQLKFHEYLWQEFEKNG